MNEAFNLQKLARLEDATSGSRSVIREKRTSLLHGPRDTGRGARPVGVSARTAYKLAKALLGEEETERRMEDQTRLSRSLGNDPLYKYLDVLYHYPAFLFHEPPPEIAKELDRPLGRDPSTSLRASYRHSLDLLLRSGFGTRTLGARLRAFRMQHDLTLVETAALVGLSKSELHRLERAERSPSPRVRYRILRLLTLPLGGQGFSHAEIGTGSYGGVQAAGPQRPRRLGWAGNASRAAAGIQAAARRASSEGSQACPEQGRGGTPRRVSPPPAAGGPTRSFDSAQDKPARRPSPSRAGTRGPPPPATRAALAVTPPPPR